MASNGIMNYAKGGKCRICLRVRNTDTQVKPVGEVRHGYATGYVWERIDRADCISAATMRVINKHKNWEQIRSNLKYYCGIELPKPD